MDSQVALGTLIKGRSSSRALNKELSLGNMIAYDLYAEGVYFETSRNRADAPTRVVKSRNLPDRLVVGSRRCRGLHWL